MSPTDRPEEPASQPDQPAGLGLVHQAQERERHQAYDQAILLWQQVGALGIPGWEAQAQIERLSALGQQADRRAEVVSQLALRHQDLKPVLGEVVRALGAADQALAAATLALAQDLLSSRSDTAAFLSAWQELRALRLAPQAPAAGLDFAALHQRLHHGQLALFLGAELPRHFDPAQPGADDLARALAHRIQLVSPPETLSAMAELFQMSPEHGPAALLRHLHPLLAAQKAPSPLYQMLAHVPAPLLIISAAHDTLLEAAFTQAKKRYAVASAVVHPAPGYHPGQVLLRYSDRDGLAPLLGDELSKRSLLEQGYSMIFKIRGTCPQPDDPRELCSFVLSERSHFAFARHVDKLLPSYLCAQLGTRGLLFLGFAPASWEDRLFSGAILDSRRSREPAQVVQREARSFEAAYWRSRGVQQHPYDLPDFVQRLSEASR